MDSDDEETPALSASSLAALQSFYNQRDADIEVFEQLRFKASNDLESESHVPVSISAFKEDWNASQFWFIEATASFLASQLLADITTNTSIAIISAPSVFVELKNILSASAGTAPLPARICLLEYDERFELLGDFIKYDFNKPTNLPSDLQHGFDRILIDPPYHSEECLLKYSKTVDWLGRGQGKVNEEQRRIVCSGGTMADTVIANFAGVKLAKFEPQHSVRLDNKYACFANFEFSEQ